MIDVCLLGTGGMMPLPGRWLSSLVIRLGGRLMLIDCGEGTQIPLRALGWGLRTIDTIWISHYHADHVSGLVGILLTLANAHRVESLHIFGPAGLSTIVASQRVLAPALPYEVQCHELTPGDRHEIGGLIATCAAGQHSVPVLAYRFELPRRPRFLPERAHALGVPVAYWRELQAGHAVEVAGRLVRPHEVLGTERRGISIAYVTDTRPTPAIEALVEGVDLLVCEGMYGDPAEAARAAETGHMTFVEAAQLAHRARVNALWLTHFSPAMETPLAYRPIAAAIFPNVVIGVDGLTTTLTFNDEPDRKVSP